jgi:hypothetical protein
MRTTLMLALAALALSACAPRYYDDRYGYDRYYGPAPGHVEYTDRDRYDDPYYANDPAEVRDHSRDYRDHY